MDTFMLPNFADPSVWISLLTLTALEIVLGIDNIIFISILAGKLPEEKQPSTRRLGLILALVFRLILLFFITWLVTLTKPIFYIPFMSDPDGGELGISVKDIILILGGFFLIAKSVSEMFHKLEGKKVDATGKVITYTVSAVVTQIILVDLVFSFDSILTAIGLVKEVSIMVIAIIISMAVMLAFAGPISRYINKHPSLQMLALAFLVLIGFVLIAGGLHQKIDKSTVYVAMAFALVVEMMNIRLRNKNSVPIQLHDSKEVKGSS
jgi:predicted tellurium resistance membrane protein TerC